MTDPIITRLTELAEKATSGPWTIRRTMAALPLYLIEQERVDEDRSDANASFIAALVTAWPTLRARLKVGEDARASLVEVRGMVDRVWHGRVGGMFVYDVIDRALDLFDDDEPDDYDDACAKGKGD